MNSDHNGSPSTEGEVLVRVEGVSKKFCRSLKQSLWYGVRDIAAELNPFARSIAGKGEGEAGNRPPARDEDLRPGEFWAVRDVSFELRRGECLGLIGHNGAGKTTLLKMLNGLILPDTGKIEMRGRVGALIALGAGFNPILSGRENVYVNAAVLGLSKREIDEKLDEIVDFSELRDFIDMPVQSYSSGMQVRLGFAVATALQPDVLILDEVLAVGDMAFKAKCLNALGEMRIGGTSFILVSHDMLSIARYCQRALYLAGGRVACRGATADAICAYESDLILSRPSGDSGDPNGHQAPVAGSGRLAITGVSFHPSSAAPSGALRSGQPLQILIDCRNPGPDPLPVTIEIILRDHQGVLHRSGGGPSFLVPPGRAGGERFRCRFESLPLNTPLLRVSVCLWSPDFTELYDWRREMPLRAESPPGSTGRIHLACQIDHLAPRASPPTANCQLPTDS